MANINKYMHFKFLNGLSKTYNFDYIWGLGLEMDSSLSNH